jgi:hypothetical protein
MLVRPTVLLAILWIVAGSVTISAQELNTEGPEANPGRPTVSTPATITPVGYLQFETGTIGAWHSPEFSSQQGVIEVIKFSVSHRLEFLAASEPFVHSRVQGHGANATADLFLGLQGIVRHGKGASPTIAVSYSRRVYNGGAPDLDLGSPRNSVLVLASADVRGFHYDANAMLNEVVEGHVHRLQLGQSLSVSHPLGRRFGLSGEIWHFTQPFLRGNAVGSLWALSYTANRNLVFDGGFNRGLTSTSTRWEVFGGFTYLLPHKLLGH